MIEDAKVKAARAQAEAARARLVASATELKDEVQARVSPSNLASDVWESVRDRGEVVANKAAEVAVTRPVATSAAAAGATLLLARKPIARLFRRLRHGKAEPHPVYATPRSTGDKT